jgi:hypothetical protein
MDMLDQAINTQVNFNMFDVPNPVLTHMRLLACAHMFDVPNPVLTHMRLLACAHISFAPRNTHF